MTRKKSGPRRFRNVDEVITLWRSIGAPTFDQRLTTISWEGFCAVNGIECNTPTFAAAWVAPDSLCAYGSRSRTGPMFVANTLGRIQKPAARTIEFVRCAYWQFDKMRVVKWLSQDWREHSNVLSLLNGWMRDHAPSWDGAYGGFKHFLPSATMCSPSSRLRSESCVCDAWNDCADEVDELSRVAHHATHAMQNWRLVRFDAYEFRGENRPEDA